MRIDDIDLVGPFHINGTIGTEGQILGFSGSQTHWITASGSGGPGGPGPLGPTGGSTGFSLHYNSPNLIFQSPTGLTNSAELKYINTCETFQHASYTSIPSSTSFVSAISAINGSVLFDTNFSSIIASGQSLIKCGRFNTHIGGRTNEFGYNTYVCNYRSAFLGGCLNRMTGIYSGFLSNVSGGGKYNYLSRDSYASVFGGRVNHNENSLYSTIVGGFGNATSTYLASYKNRQVSIIGGCYTAISSGILFGNYYHKNSAILGGRGTALVISNGNVCNSVIIGGCGANSLALLLDHYLSSNNSVIVGGKDIKVPTLLYPGRPYFFNDAAFLNYAVITNNMKLSDYTTTVGLTGFGGTNSRANVILNQKQSGFSNYVSFWGSSGIRQRFRICP